MKSKLLAALICPAIMAFSVSSNAVPTHIAAAGDHTLFIDSGNVYGYGMSKWGVLSTGSIVPGSTSSEYRSPTFTTVGNAKSVAAGLWRSAALLNDGKVKIWGMAATGVMSGAVYSVPTSGIVTDIALSQSKIYYIISGEIYEWDFSSSPLKVSSSQLGMATRVAAGVDHAVALYNDGSVATYGKNAYGQLGNGSTSELTTMTKIVGVSGAVNIAIAGYTSTITLNSGTVLGFGRNQNGQLGTGEKTNKLTPIVVTALEGAKKIYGGEGFVAAMSAAGTLRVAGWHNYIAGSLYNSSTVFVDLPGTGYIYDVGGNNNTHVVSSNVAGILQGWGGGTVSVGNGTNNEYHTLVTIPYDVLPPSLIVAAPVVTAPIVNVAPPPPAIIPVVTAPINTTPTVVAPKKFYPQCKFDNASVPWNRVTDTDAYNCGIKMYRSTTACVKANQKNNKHINVVAFCTQISDDGDRINCNNGWGNGPQCAPGKSALHNNAANASPTNKASKNLVNIVGRNNKR